jgi:hypothetical protein
MIHGLRRYPKCKQHLIRLAQIVNLNTGVNPVSVLRSLRTLPAFLRDARTYQHACDGRFPLDLGTLLPVLTDRSEAAGTIGGHYFHQDLWAARRIFARRPDAHLDIGSRIDGFIAHLLVFMPVTVIDVRALYFSVPVGRERLEFNAHRVFDPHTVLEEFSTLQLLSFSVVDDHGALRENVEPALCTGLQFGCGLFEFTRNG